MAVNDSTITMQGNLVADPVQRLTANGARVTRFRIAQTGRWFDKATQEWRDGDPNFMSVSCWRQLGLHTYACLRKGDSVVVHGRLVYREYDDRASVRRQVHEIEAFAVGPDLSRYMVDVRRPERQRPADPAAASGGTQATQDAAPRTADRAAATGPDQPVNPWSEPEDVPAAAEADAAA